MTVSSKKSHVVQSIQSVFVWKRRRPKAGDAFTQTRLMPAFRDSTGFHVKYRRLKAGCASPEGLLTVERRVLRCLGVWVFGFQGFWVQG